MRRYFTHWLPHPELLRHCIRGNGKTSKSVKKREGRKLAVGVWWGEGGGEEVKQDTVGDAETKAKLGKSYAVHNQSTNTDIRGCHVMI